MPELSIAEIRKVFIQEATRGAERAALATQREIQRLMPVKTGQSRRSVTCTRPRRSGDTITVSIGSNVRHVRWLDEGTGEFGPRHEKITPKARQALSFVAAASKGKGQAYTLQGRARNSARVGAVMEGLVTVRSVKGIEPMHFVKLGYEASRQARVRELQAVGPRVSERLGLASA